MLMPKSFRGPCTQAKKDSSELESKSKAMKGKLAVLEEQVKAAETTLEAAVQPIGNLVHDSVPVSNDEVILVTSVYSGRMSFFEREHLQLIYRVCMCELIHHHRQPSDRTIRPCHLKMLLGRHRPNSKPMNGMLPSDGIWQHSMQLSSRQCSCVMDVKACYWIIKFSLMTLLMA